MDLKGHTAADSAGRSTPLDVDPPALRRLSVDLESTADQLRSAVTGAAHLRTSPAGWGVTTALTGWTNATAARLVALADDLDQVGTGLRAAAVGYAETDARLRMPDPAGARVGGR